MNAAAMMKNQRGQGVLEYILILCITVILIMSLFWQFSSAFRKYAENYFGEYILCLMETGELPGETNGQCKSEYKGFSIADGKTATGGSAYNPNGGSGVGGLTGSGGSGTGTNGNGSGGKDGKNGKGGKSGSGRSTASNSGGSSSSGDGTAGELGANAGGSSSGRGGASGRSSKSRVGSSSSVGAQGAGAGEGKGKEGLKPIGTVAGSTSESYGNRGGRRTAMGGGFTFDGQKDEDKKAEERPTTKAVAQNVGDDLKPAKAVEKPPRKPAAYVDDGGGFTIGGFLRYILIAGILIAIFILFGGQLLAISKGGEK